MSSRRYTAAELEPMPTLAQGQTDNLKIDTGDGERIWLARTHIVDGEQWDHRINVERYNGRRWETVESYDGGPLPPDDD